MNDFIRPFSDAEFKKACLSAGYPEIAWQYCHEKWQENYKDILKEDISEEDLPELKEYEGWTSENAREQAWRYVKEYSRIDIYVQQRKSGHGHEWSKLFCEELVQFTTEDAVAYWNTFDALRSSRFKSGEEIEIRHDWFDCIKRDTLSCREYVIAVRNLAKGEGETVERYIDYRLGSDKPLTWEDEEFLRLKKEYIKSGLNEFAAEQRAYKEAYENDSDIELDSIRNNRSHDLKRDMLEMMFPNDDIDSEDFEDGLDFEDMND